MGSTIIGAEHPTSEISCPSETSRATGTSIYSSVAADFPHLVLQISLLLGYDQKGAARLVDRIDNLFDRINAEIKTDTHLSQRLKALLSAEDDAENMMWDSFRKGFETCLEKIPDDPEEQKNLCRKWATGLEAIDSFFDRTRQQDQERAVQHHGKLMQDVDVETAQSFKQLAEFIVSYHLNNYGNFTHNQGFGEKPLRRKR